METSEDMDYNTINLHEWAQTPFSSQAEMLAAMKHPRYSHYRGEDFRAAVERKIALEVESPVDPESPYATPLLRSPNEGGVYTVTFTGNEFGKRTRGPDGVERSNPSEAFTTEQARLNDELSQVFGPLAGRSEARTIGVSIGQDGRARDIQY